MLITCKLWNVENVRAYQQVAVWKRPVLIRDIKEHRVQGAFELSPTRAINMSAIKDVNPARFNQF